MLFEEVLDKYLKKGQFTFRANENFALQCNAPKDSSGVYLIYSVMDNSKELIYIGSSGQKDEKGNLKVRKGGLYDRLVNGYHPNRFGQAKRIKRRYAFPLQMKEENIDQIHVYWWVTHDLNNTDFPTDVERFLESKYLSLYNRYPSWHQKKRY